MRAASRLRRAKRIGIFGGTFDPVHYGHLVCAEQLREAVGLDPVVFMPCFRQPHKPARSLSDPSHRLAMLRAAARRYPGFTVSDLEIRRGGLSFSVDTVLEMRSLIGPGPEIWLMLGMDAFIDLPAWKDPDVLRAECGFAVATRPGYTGTGGAGRKGRAQARRAAGRCRFIEITALDISSTGIRRRVARGKSIRFLLPDSVEAYVRRKGLYL
jgi:nicotinate-nucleotide adenylyltransferase